MKLHRNAECYYYREFPPNTLITADNFSIITAIPHASDCMIIGNFDCGWLLSFKTTLTSNFFFHMGAKCQKSDIGNTPPKAISLQTKLSS